MSGEFQIHAYKADRGSPLAGFLRMVVGHMAARGLMSGALLPSLAPYKADHVLRHPLRTNILPSLYELILGQQSVLPGSRLIHEMFKDYVVGLEEPDISVAPAPGLDADGHPAVGSLLRIKHKGKKGGGKLLEEQATSFFTVNKVVRVLECVGAKQTVPWQVSDELLLSYVRRTFADTPNVLIKSGRN